MFVGQDVHLLDLNQGIIAILKEVPHFLRVHLHNAKEQLTGQSEG